MASLAAAGAAAKSAAVRLVTKRAEGEGESEQNVKARRPRLQASVTSRRANWQEKVKSCSPFERVGIRHFLLDQGKHSVLMLPNQPPYVELTCRKGTNECTPAGKLKREMLLLEAQQQEKKKKKYRKILKQGTKPHVECLHVCVSVYVCMHVPGSKCDVTRCNG